ncbi:hypothetical protein IDM40_12940 [Nocardiopsis sp. HNM0947]|uniref:Uncharacterized protein n=1 Tax=Nocardiopsis coralli TaxID=2772213 RepID=A0ABR9P6Y8_9ACTN|nr:hypothetical protein [Nocardiopsis coralli]MBE2999607.1 hypothetical protein [Nocardiopsis coralli]
MGRTQTPDGPGDEHPDRDHGSGDRGGDDGRGQGGKKIDLSFAQVAAAGLATLTAATLASYLDVYGTVIGTAVMAILSTSASPLLSHWFSRSGEQAKQLAEKAVATKAPGAAKGRGASAATGTQNISVDLPPVQQDDDATRTMAMPVLGADLAQADQEATRVDGHGGAVDPEETVLIPAQTQEADAGTAVWEPARTGGDDDGGDGDSTADEPEEAPTPRRRGWRAVLIPAALVFTVVMLVILAFELLTGRSLTAWTRGLDEQTSPSIVGGNSAPVEEEPEPEPEEPVVEDAPTEEPATPEPEPTPQPEQGQPTEPGTEQPEGGNGTDGGSGNGSGGNGGGTQPTPDPGDQETDPPAEEEPGDDPGGSVPPPREPGDEQDSELQSD